MAGISSKAAGKLNNDLKFNGKELNEDLDLYWYEYGFRNNFDPQLGRFHSIDPLASDYPYYTPYQFAGNQPTIAVDIDGLEPAFINDLMQWGATKVASNPNSNTSKAIGAFVGVGKSIEKTFTGAVNTLLHPIETGKGLLKMNTPEGIANMAIGVAGKVNTLQNGTGFEKAALISETVTDVATVVAGTKGLGAGVKGAGAAGEVAGIANPIPGQVSRVIPNFPGEVTTLGRAGSADVFVTASSDIQGLNATQIAQKITIPESSTGFKVITFETPKGIASPINRTNPGFVGGGRTGGGAREFVVPNQPIPKNAKTKTVN
jgi:RHS repeat-associated protein